jgi:hypothetical protein
MTDQFSPFPDHGRSSRPEPQPSSLDEVRIRAASGRTRSANPFALAINDWLHLSGHHSVLDSRVRIAGIGLLQVSVVHSRAGLGLATDVAASLYRPDLTPIRAPEALGTALREADARARAATAPSTECALASVLVRADGRAAVADLGGQVYRLVNGYAGRINATRQSSLPGLPAEHSSWLLGSADDARDSEPPVPAYEGVHAGDRLLLYCDAESGEIDSHVAAAMARLTSSQALYHFQQVSTDRDAIAVIVELSNRPVRSASQAGTSLASRPVDRGISRR